MTLPDNASEDVEIQQSLGDDGGDHIAVAVERDGDDSAKDTTTPSDSLSPDQATEDAENGESGITNGSKKKMETLEIDDQNENEAEESFDDDEMDDLLGNSSSEKPSMPQRRCCSGPEKVGNMRILLPTIFYRTGWGIAGPHWFGPFCVLFLVGLASHYFVAISVKSIGPITATICVMFAASCAYNLANCAYRDPGVVKLQPATSGPQDTDDDQRLQFRWCDRCQVFQPVDGAHCSDCNVCIAGFDHHCVWMGTCIGKNNYKQFVAFNISWLLYLIYAITWVSVLGPLIFGRHPKHEV
ncbi:Palmitoyltransferase ZDHHC5 [Seminavis robusta]|uniref:Palmitoyltransferase n=1 Tax=Seminavis robusta TaxID=568900 RepID=A0A9N8EJH7_9STRA|nr:Palmitoyltransferase ZDHHC5 [Seminavis robusta]|eukprot:Sro1100_g241280.1 Palmitoyltransferase ZDHHC5 (298) ;mRNA; f:21915-23071